MKKYNYFYKITNNINGKYYYGVHSTNNLDDGYLGSGTYLKRAYNKYGIENFSKEILKYFDTAEEMFKYEQEIVNEELVNDKNCYNVKTGGKNKYIYSDITRQKISESKSGKTLSEEHKQKISMSKKGKSTPLSARIKLRQKLKGNTNGRGNKGSHKSIETRRKIGESNKGKTPWNKGKKGIHTAWNKGKTNVYSEETLQKMRKPKSEEHKKKLCKKHERFPNHWKLVDGKRVYYN